MGPQQLKYMTVLRDSSDCFSFSSLSFLGKTLGTFLACEYGLGLVFACCWIDLIVEFHLQTPWSFRASTTPILVATIQALLVVELIFAFFLVFPESENGKRFEVGKCSIYRKEKYLRFLVVLEFGEEVRYMSLYR